MDVPETMPTHMPLLLNRLTLNVCAKEIIGIDGSVVIVFVSPAAVRR